jgi:hypothetical protein
MKREPSGDGGTRSRRRLETPNVESYPVLLSKEPKPLDVFDFRKVQEPLEGLLRNVDGDLQRRIKELHDAGNVDEHRQLTLLLITLRIAANSYQALRFLLSDFDENDKRLPRFVLVVPSVNRQIMDLWFTLVYMLDDFGPRSLLYEQCAYRQLREHIDYNRKRYGANLEWKDWFEDVEELLDQMETQIPLTEQKADPKSIDSWPHPHALSERVTRSQGFLQFIHEILYSETSIEAHLKPAGLMMVAGILVTDMMPEQLRQAVDNRIIHQYKFRNFCRTVVALLGIVSEIEVHCNLGNREQASKVWQRLADKNADAKDVYEARYKSMLE